MLESPQQARSAPVAGPPAGVDLLLSQVVESAPTGVVMVDGGGKIRLVNAEFERMFGYGRGELLGQPVDLLLPARLRGDHAGLRAGYLKDPSPRAMGAGRELFGCRADGSEFPVEIGLNALPTPAGTMVIAAVVDISARRLLEGSFRNVFDAAPCGMVMVDAKGRIVMANTRMAELFGYGAPELLGLTIDALVPERHRRGHAGLRLGYMEAPSLRSMGAGRDLSALHRDGSELFVEIGLSPVHWDHGTMVLAAVTDITARKRLELELRQANTNLEEFTYVASHDLRSPLRGIADLVEWIGEDLAAHREAEVQSNLDRVKLRVRRMERIIDDLLAYARAGRVSPELVLVDPRALVADILELQPIPPGFEVPVQVRAGSFRAARTPLETVLRNLIDNAVKHHDRPQGRVEITVTEEDQYCCFSVADDGPGIPVKAQARMFKLFQTMSASERQGSGIGLALSKRLVECHGGRITVDSRDGERGTTFRFFWPRFQRRDANE